LVQEKVYGAAKLLFTDTAEYKKWRLPKIPTTATPLKELLKLFRKITD